MGYMRHHAIIVTSWKDEAVKGAQKEALKHFSHVSEIVESPINRYSSFFIAPDGSKEGWEPSDKGDDSRNTFISYLNSLCHEDGSSPLDWAELFYGDDGGESEITRHSRWNDDKSD